MHENETNDEGQDLKRFAITYSLDNRFLRRECSSCGLPFKTEVTDEEISHLLAPTFKRIEQEHGISLSTNGEEDNRLAQFCCPYCGNVDRPEHMLTDEFSNYVYHWINREVVHPMLRDFQEQLADSFGRSGSRGSRGFLSVSFSYEPGEMLLPPRPISGPALPDMHTVELLCCQERIKILEVWSETIYCPHCTKQLVLT